METITSFGCIFIIILRERAGIKFLFFRGGVVFREEFIYNEENGGEG